MNAHNLPAVPIKPADVVAEYHAKLYGGKIEKTSPDGVVEVVAEYIGIKALIEEYRALENKIKSETMVGGTYVGPIMNGQSDLYEKKMAANLLESGWKRIMQVLQIDVVASAADQSRLDLMMKDPPDLTKENIYKHLGDYVNNPRFHKLKGLAECFTGLDPAFKSHSKVKIGVQGLPKKIIITRVMGEYSTGYGAKELENVIDAINVVQGDPRIGYREFHDFVEAAKVEKTEYKGLSLKVYQNGNGHLTFSPHKLQQVNDALAEFYGDVLPDTPEENAKKRPGTDVSKDLQFYPTPKKVIDHILRDVGFVNKEEIKFLEPSCGDGRIMEAVCKAFPQVRAVGIEVHQPRAEEAMKKGFKVLVGNFLQVKPNPVYDFILMNPPFYGLHWKKHLQHARAFLRPPNEERRDIGGSLICILPATAFYDGHLADMGIVQKDAHLERNGWRCSNWKDLPVAAFAESGTNVPTGYVRVSA